MPTGVCPVCGVSVKTENLEAHIAKVHPHTRIEDVLSETAREDVRRARRPAGRAFHIPRWAYVVIGAVLVIGIAFVAGPYLLPPKPAGTAIVAYCSSPATVLIAHYHPLLIINYNGVQEHLPWDSTQTADIGYLNLPNYTNPAYYCPSGEIHMLHTHDGSGILHVEIPTTIPSTPTLGNFFAIWGQPLSSSSVWIYSGTVTATMLNEDTLAIKDFSSNPAGVPLYEPRAGPFGNGFTIPQSYIFNGAYGSGQSQGVYSGEVIWLNITA